MSVEAHGSFEPLADEWDDLASRAAGTPWQRPGWFSAFWNAFGDGELEILAMRREGRLTAVAPFHRKRGELRALSNWHTPSFAVLAEDSAARAELGRALFSHGARRVVFMFLPPEDTTLDDYAAIARFMKHRTIVRTLERSPYVPIDGEWDAYYAARDTDLRKELRRRRRRLDEQGEVAFEVHDGAERLDELLDEGFRVEASGWKGAQGTAISSQPETERFYREIARWGAERGWLRLAFLRLDGVAIGFHFAWEADAVHYLLKMGIDEAWGKFAPGKLLAEHMIRRAFEERCRMYDFLGEEMPWKMEWTSSVRELKLLQAFSPRPAGVADWAAWSFGRPLAKRALALRHRLPR